ncbi:AraC-like ligand-binding domain-containing protein [Pseudooceanicola sp.]|uniref:AraC-like ligand-binding domain-containing protein n=1 Tax=Pseudooceanicola sp. TaxID=1914328 RepID=UPI00405A3BF1
MDLVFSTDRLPRAQRYDAWRAAICDCYVHVDVKATRPETYRGFIREAEFGDIVLTDILLSEQSIRRNAQHISQLDKDCYYLQFIHHGNLRVLQRGESHASNAARGAMFCATEQYELQCLSEVRSFYLELPRADFAQRFPKESIPVSTSFDSTRGLGRIATEFCAMLASEGGGLDTGTRRQLGDQLMDMLAITLQATHEDTPVLDGSVRQARLRSVKLWIENRLTDPDLTLEDIAAANGISLRYLHQLFEQEDKTVSEWIWDRRLQRCYTEIAKRDGRLITSIAYENGFNSSAHFSTLFRRKYGVSPRGSLAAAGGLREQ